MNCYCCGKPGRAFGIWRSPVQRNVFTKFKCLNPACSFVYTNFAGYPARAQPTWMARSNKRRGS